MDARGFAGREGLEQALGMLLPPRVSRFPWERRVCALPGSLALPPSLPEGKDQHGGDQNRGLKAMDVGF